MAKINNTKAQEIGRFVIYNPDSGRAHCRIVRSDGSVLRRNGDGWKIAGRVLIDPHDFVRDAAQKVRDGLIVIPDASEPSVTTLMHWETDHGHCQAIDGCRVEPDGQCPHGYPSWLLAMGLI